MDRLGCIAATQIIIKNKEVTIVDGVLNTVYFSIEESTRPLKVASMQHKYGDPLKSKKLYIVIREVSLRAR